MATREGNRKGNNATPEERGARPVAATRGRGGEARSLRMKFTDGSSDRLEEIEWEEWLHTFEERDLVFVHQQQKRDGSQSNFFRLDSPDREDG